MSLRWTAYVAPKPPKGASKRQFCRFRITNRLRWKKVCCKVCLCENCQRQVVRHSLAYPSVQKWLVGDVPFCVKFWVKMTHAIRRITSKWSKIDLYSLRRKCSRKNLAFSDISFMAIFAEVTENEHIFDRHLRGIHPLLDYDASESKSTVSYTHLTLPTKRIV